VSACCARCGEPDPLSSWRERIRVCAACWVYLEHWALCLEEDIRRMVQYNDARKSVVRGTGYFT
jgi:hypothetical protein